MKHVNPSIEAQRRVLNQFIRSLPSVEQYQELLPDDEIAKWNQDPLKMGPRFWFMNGVEYARQVAEALVEDLDNQEIDWKEKPVVLKSKSD